MMNDYDTDLAGFALSLHKRGKSADTVRKYQKHLKEFFLFADKLDEQNIYRFRDYLSKKYSVTTVNSHLSVLSQFCKYKRIYIDFHNFTIYYAEKEKDKTSKDDKYKLPPMKSIKMNQWLENIKRKYTVGDKIKCRTLETGMLTEGTIIYKGEHFICAELKIGYRMSFSWYDIAMGKINHTI